MTHSKVYALVSIRYNLYGNYGTTTLSISNNVRRITDAILSTDINPLTTTVSS